MNITKLRAFNFKKFQFIEIDFKAITNVIVGDNESGKSSILLAIDLLLSGSRSKVETLGLDTLFNNQTIQEFFKSNTYGALPHLTIEIYFDKMDDDQFYGQNNSLKTDHFGISCKHSVKFVLFFRKNGLSFKVSCKCSENFDRSIGRFCSNPGFAA